MKKAQHRADDAEADAADAVDFALYVLDQAEYAVADAVTARGDADAISVAWLHGRVVGWARQGMARTASCSERGHLRRRGP
ncbi:MAG: hypothetical protein QOI76_1785 [Frankiales bacterium]|nr:hypothetical protein [Frankiales bacterium]MEA2668368.1 hypothetical protein [Chloroflexota bacterium]